MRILMLGWEFPPFISGGLGTACYGLTKALSDLAAEVLFVLPRGESELRNWSESASSLHRASKAAARTPIGR